MFSIQKIYLYIKQFFALSHEKFSKCFSFKAHFYYSLFGLYVNNTFYYYNSESTKKKIKYYEIFLLEKKKSAHSISST